MENNRPAIGIAWMLAAGFSFVALNAIVRYMGNDLPAAQNAFLRFAFGCLFVLPLLPRLRAEGFAPGALRLFGLRGVVHAAGVVCWFYAMAHIPMAEVTAIGYLNPILVTLGAALIFGEALSLRRIVAIMVALAGAVVILRPGARVIEPGHLAQLGNAFLFASGYLIASRLTRIASPEMVVSMLSVVVTLILLPLAVTVWQSPTPLQYALLAGTAVFATAGHYFMTRAFASAPLTVTQPVTFLNLIWASMSGYFLFGESVDPFVLLGGGIIIGSIAYLTWRDAVRRRAAAG
ncbi:DMT family transporter [Cereibacter sp. SYSU M97828]|nr:DMT family transporter [Cereibacter flavus]